MTFTAVTFAPVQSFIRSSRKLRDLYGSSLLLSHLARALYVDANAKLGPAAVISPAAVSSTRGVPNTLLIQGCYKRGDAQQAVLTAWGETLKVCREWLEKTLKGSSLDPGDWETSWGPSWKACERHSWEVFHGQGNSIEAAERALSRHKQARAWEIPNWTGESSTLSSTEAVVRPRMAEKVDPRRLTERDEAAHKQEARDFLQLLCQHKQLGEAFAGKNEEICITELIKRLVTYRSVAKDAFSVAEDAIDQIIPARFNTLSTIQVPEAERSESIVWFMADGDKVGDYLRSLRGSADEVQARRAFSSSMRSWAADLYQVVPKKMGADRATLVYAGGDDVFGALHESTPGSRDLRRQDLFDWLLLFPQLWAENGQAGLTVSMGLVWADSQVPQREALQHAREAEAEAKARGRDRFALRLVYAGCNHLQWTCPWEWLEPILSSYRDREGRCWALDSGAADSRKWRHLAEDLLWLQERHAIGDAIPAADASAAAKAGEIAQLEQSAKATSTAEAASMAGAAPTAEVAPMTQAAPTAQVAPTAKAEAVALGLISAYFPDLPQRLANLNPKQPRPGDAPSLQKPERGRRLDQWLLDLGQVMAGLERWRDASKEPNR
jgi:CRISPR-associated protein Cmr2